MRRFAACAMVAVFPVLVATQAAALGLGGYMDLSGGSGEAEVEVFGFEEDYDIDEGSFGLGFVLDTNPMGQGFFSYRLNVGFEGKNVDVEFPGDDETIELAGLVVNDVFAFRIMQNSLVRLWAGPEVGIGFYSGEFEDDSDIEASLFRFTLGGAFGANFYPGDGRFGICPSVGFRANFYNGEVEDTDTGVEGDIDGYTTTFFINVAFLFGK